MIFFENSTNLISLILSTECVNCASQKKRESGLDGKFGKQMFEFKLGIEPRNRGSSKGMSQTIDMPGW